MPLSKAWCGVQGQGCGEACVALQPCSPRQGG